MVRRILFAACVSFLCVAGVSVRAQIYGGALASDTSWQEDDINWTSSRALGDGFGRRSARFDKENDEYKILLGYRVGDHLAIEGAYQDLGQVNRNQRRQDDGTLFGEALFHATEVTGSSLTVLGIWPFKIKALEVEVFAKAGVFGWSADSSVSLRRLAPAAGGLEVDTLEAIEVTDRSSESSVSAVYGVGVMIELWRGLYGRVEYEQVEAVGGGTTASDQVIPADFDFAGPLTLGLEVDVPSFSGGLVYCF